MNRDKEKRLVSKGKNAAKTNKRKVISKRTS